ncbi:lipoate--protein ligase family protein [Halalkalibacillus halophilus]|uniref:lipoate--protein ligase family protein n=1 Tax=Halalkalibacillus halophilus TaxID=392827 RepID=UPI000482F8E4|nr:biotin/lipoate A/B protein ligase family protein [Halalkalibacillus halophilus]
MKHQLLQTNKIRLIDHSKPEEAEIISSFATDDALCLSVSETKQLTMRYWVHRPTIVLGIPDSRLPYLSEGTSYLKELGYEVMVRNSGGLAVVLDKGILNISLIFADSKSYNLHDGYDAMVDFIDFVFSDMGLKIEAYEITASYCPGSYDLSVDGKKFAGISQRRVKNGSAVQIYLCVEGSGSERANHLKAFYQKSLKNSTTKFTYPTIDPSVMISLEELTNQSFSVQETIDMIERKLEGHEVKLKKDELTEKEFAWFEQRLKLMNKRNQHI